MVAALSNKPNIILINCDDLGYGDLGCYGSSVNKTPNIDFLAREGMMFTDFYSASPVCSPSRGALMTGCYPKRIGFESFDGDHVLFSGHAVGLNRSEFTIPQMLKEEGYTSMIIGKWHCGDQEEFLPLQHGFDRYYGLPYSNDMGRQRRKHGIQEELDKRYPPLPLIYNNKVIQEQPDQGPLIERYVEHATMFIRENNDKPFFLYFAPLQVHLPLYAPQRFVDESQNGDFGACVAAVDWALGAMIQELKDQGLYENTLLIFTSDNGSRGDNGASNAPLRGRKGFTYEGGMRVPCIMSWKGKIKGGRKCSNIASNIDFLATLASICGGELPTDRIVDSVNMTPLLLKDQEKEYKRQTMLYYSRENLEAVRVGKWKLHFRKRENVINELYDLENDIGETKNVFDENPGIVQQLQAYAKECVKDLGDKARDVKGENVREIGRAKNPKMLTTYNPDHPYIVALYDKIETG
ncbi:MAG TPA: Cerebroside-sulfatase [Clostridiales bacterium]|nr:Cerebroside-sulfatase [Clostridiales bacterium]